MAWSRGLFSSWEGGRSRASESIFSIDLINTAIGIEIIVAGVSNRERISAYLDNYEKLKRTTYQ